MIYYISALSKYQHNCTDKVKETSLVLTILHVIRRDRLEDISTFDDILLKRFIHMDLILLLTFSHWDKDYMSCQIYSMYLDLSLYIDD